MNYDNDITDSRTRDSGGTYGLDPHTRDSGGTYRLPNNDNNIDLTGNKGRSLSDEYGPHRQPDNSKQVKALSFLEDK